MSGTPDPALRWEILQYHFMRFYDFLSNTLSGLPYVRINVYRSRHLQAWQEAGWVRSAPPQ